MLASVILHSWGKMGGGERRIRGKLQDHVVRRSGGQAVRWSGGQVVVWSTQEARETKTQQDGRREL